MVTRNFKLTSLLGAFSLAISPLVGFEQEPWLTEPYLFTLQTVGGYSYYPSIADVQGEGNTNSNNVDLGLNLRVAMMSDLEIQTEAQLTRSAFNSFGFESTAFQLRYQIFNDLLGDPICWTTGLNYRYVPYHRLKDPTTFYGYVSNLEWVNSIGKEIDSDPDWIMKFWGLTKLGMSNKLVPWLGVDAVSDFHLNGPHTFRLLGKSFFSFGSESKINLSQFDGYWRTWSQAIDVGAGYRYQFAVEGALLFEYTYRVYASATPERESIFTLKYDYPFSIF